MDCNVVEKEAEWHDKFMADTHGLTFFVAKGLFEMGMDMSKWQLAPPSAQSLACTTELVRVDASHLFTPVHTSNPFSADARKKFINALVAIDRNLVAETPADLPHVTLPSNNGPVTMHSPTALSAAQAAPTPASLANDLADTRKQIDSVDRELVALLAKRSQLSMKARQIKVKMGRGLSLYDPEREQQVLDQRRAWSQAQGMDPSGTEEIFDCILRVSRRIQGHGLARY